MRATAIVGATAALAAVLLLDASAWAAAAGKWPVFNHDHRNSRANRAEKNISPHNVGRLAPRWRVDGLSGVTSTPAVVDGVVYFGDWSGVFHARRAGDGREIWSRHRASPNRPPPPGPVNRAYST